MTKTKSKPLFNSDKPNDFSLWDESILLSPEQRQRFLRAYFSKRTFLNVNVDDHTGVIVGERKASYDVTLVNCTCFDFARRKLPCKHIYALAIQFSLIPMCVIKDLLRDTQLVANVIYTTLDEYSFSDLKSLQKILSQYLRNKPCIAPSDSTSCDVIINTLFTVSDSNNSLLCLKDEFAPFVDKIYHRISHIKQKEKEHAFKEKTLDSLSEELNEGNISLEQYNEIMKFYGWK